MNPPALRAMMRGVLFRYGWDTRCRHIAPVRILREELARVPAAGGEPVVLDVGCGRLGVAAFLDRTPVMGVDLEPPDNVLANRAFTTGSIVDLPFADRAFPCVSCVDVLQDLSPEVREQGVAEMLRVARDVLVIAAPQGEAASRCDAELEHAMVARGVAVPPWVKVSRANPYPTVDAVVTAVRNVDRCAAISVTYSEQLRVSRVVRAAATRSSVLYAVANLAFGLLARAIPAPKSANAYRMVVCVRLSRSGDQPAANC